jgi:putative hydrolase of the HAD superfamily
MKNVIFDLGAVLLEWAPQKLTKEHFPSHAFDNVYQNIFQSKTWIDLDKGVVSDIDAKKIFSDRTGYTFEQIDTFVENVRKSLHPLANGVDLLHWCKEQSLNLFCLSNMPMETYHVVRVNNTFFDVFNDIIISGDIKMIKPDKEIFEYATQRFSISPHETFFIDDHDKNIETSSSLGIKSFLYKDSPECVAHIKSTISELIL